MSKNPRRTTNFLYVLLLSICYVSYLALFSLRVPDAHSLVVRAGGEQRPVRRHSHHTHPLTVTLVRVDAVPSDNKNDSVNKHSPGNKRERSKWEIIL